MSKCLHGVLDASHCHFCSQKAAQEQEEDEDPTIIPFPVRPRPIPDVRTGDDMYELQHMLWNVRQHERSWGQGGSRRLTEILPQAPLLRLLEGGLPNK